MHVISDVDMLGHPDQGHFGSRGKEGERKAPSPVAGVPQRYYLSSSVEDSQTVRETVGEGYNNNIICKCRVTMGTMATPEEYEEEGIKCGGVNIL